MTAKIEDIGLLVGIKGDKGRVTDTGLLIGVRGKNAYIIEMGLLVGYIPPSQDEEKIQPLAITNRIGLQGQAFKAQRKSST